MTTKKKWDQLAEKQEFLSDLLDSAEAPKKKNGNGSKLPVLDSESLRPRVTRYRELTDEIKDRETERELERVEIETEAEKFVAEISKKMGYVGSVKIKGEDDLSVNVIWTHRYSNTNISEADQLRELLAEKYENYVEEKRKIEVLDTTNDGLVELQKMVKNSLKVEFGREPSAAEIKAKFALTFGVTRYLYPTRRYTEEYYTELDAAVRKETSRIFVQVKPQVKI